MKQTELLELMHAFEKSKLSLLKFEQENTKIVMEKAGEVQSMATVVSQPVALQNVPREVLIPATAENTPPQNDTLENIITIKAPLVGVFYSSPSPDSSAFAEEGKKVKKGQVICLIEAMKMMNELTSPVDGIVKRVLAQNEELVSFDQVLFEVVLC